MNFKGEFWMNWDDFCSNFDILCSVHVSLNAFSDEIAGGFSSMADIFLYY